MTNEKIFTCMGPPQSKSAMGETEVWQYASGNGQINMHGTANAFGGTNSVFVARNASVSSLGCTINIAMKQGVVQAVNYSGPTGGLLTEGEQCAFAVKSCLAP